MTDQEYLDLVLSLFNLERTTDDGSVETRLVSRFKSLAYRECCMFYDWSFLIKTKSYTEDDVADTDGYDGHIYGFELPTDFMKANLINNRYNEGFAIKGKNIYVDTPSLRLDYYSFDYTNAPIEFDQLSAYRCAIDISQLLDSQGNALEVAQGLHNIVLQTLQNKDVFSKRKKNAEFDANDSTFKVPFSTRDTYGGF